MFAESQLRAAACTVFQNGHHDRFEMGGYCGYEKAAGRGVKSKTAIMTVLKWAAIVDMKKGRKKQNGHHDRFEMGG